MADAARVTADQRAARGDTLCLTRFPATDRACGRVRAEAVARTQWEAVGVVAQTPPPQHRPGPCEKVAEEVVTLYGTTSRAVVVHSSQHEHRRHKRVEREGPASSTTLAAPGRAAAPQESCCQADAEAAAEPLRALQSASHRVAGVLEARPQYGPGRPSPQPPRVLKALRDGLQVTLHERAEVVARPRQAAGGVVRLPHGPPAGERAQRAGEVLRASKEPHGVEQHGALLTAPVMVNSLLLKQPERRDALGLV